MSLKIHSFFVALFLASSESTPVHGQSNKVPLTAVERIQQFSLPTGPILWVAESPPAAGESEDLWQAIEQSRAVRHHFDSQPLEAFVTSHPQSGWTPSLLAHLALHYSQNARFTLAMNHYETAWRLTKLGRSGDIKRVANFAFAHYVQFLTNLGRKERLAMLYQEAADRTFGRGALQQIVNLSRERYARMLYDPDIAYKCGLQALNHVARTLAASAHKPSPYINAPSPTMGFSLARLQELAQSAQLGLVAARRPPGADWVAPAVVHWRQGHYAALLRGTNGLYEIIDSTLGRPQWVTPQVLEEEATGNCLIPADLLTLA